MKSNLPPPEAFWSHFAAHAGGLRGYLQGAAGGALPILQEMEELLTHVCANLTMSCNPLDGDNVELTIGARGVFRWFPLAAGLVSMAPQLPGWKVRAFHRPQALPEVVSRDGVEIRVSSLRFHGDLLLGKYGIMLLMDADTIADYTAGYALARQITIDIAGEENFGRFVTDVQLMLLKDWKTLAPDTPVRPIAELPALFPTVLAPARMFRMPGLENVERLRVHRRVA